MPTLEEQYQQTIDEQRTHLLGLQETFNAKCEEIKAASREKIEQIPPEQKEEKQKVIEEEKAALEAALAELKSAVHESTRGTMKQLEEIQTLREEKILQHLEEQLAAL